MCIFSKQSSCLSLNHLWRKLRFCPEEAYNYDASIWLNRSICNRLGAQQAFESCGHAFVQLDPLVFPKEIGKLGRCSNWCGDRSRDRSQQRQSHSLNGMDVICQIFYVKVKSHLLTRPTTIEQSPCSLEAKWKRPAAIGCHPKVFNKFEWTIFISKTF